MDIFSTVLVFILTVSIIVTFHEFGHYIAARLCGVKVLEFSVGFGKKLFGKKFGKDKTEYKICYLPLGGYVKMLDEREGDVKEFEKNKAFNNQELHKRFFIVFAGPLFNFILAIFFYLVIFMNGYSGFQPTASIIIEKSIAENIGMQRDDKIYAVNNVEVRTWSDLKLQTVKFLSDKEDIYFEVISNNKKRKLDKVDYEKISLNNQNILQQIGILNFISKSLEIGYIEKNSPAENIGLKVGDKFLFVNNKEIKNWNQLVNIIKVNPEKYIKLNIQRDNKRLEFSVKPASVNGEDGFYGRLGISPLIDEQIIKSNTIDIQYSFFESIKLSAIKTYDFTLLTFNFIGKLIKGEASAKNISGPVGIANYAADSFDNGFTSFLSLLAMLSISIGILNLLPIPMLDGGHLMYYLVEFVVRRPIPEKAQLVFQQIGMTFLILLSFFALYNDLLRIM